MIPNKYQISNKRKQKTIKNRRDIKQNNRKKNLRLSILRLKRRLKATIKNKTKIKVQARKSQLMKTHEPIFLNLDSLECINILYTENSAV